MKTGLSAFALLVLAALIGVSMWATSQVSIVPATRDLIDFPGKNSNPWFIATLFDAYFGFLWFWLWVAYKETRWFTRGLWLVLILAAGNMAMAIYVLIQLWRLPAAARIEDLLLRRRPA
jgi:hypothetical protein